MNDIRVRFAPSPTGPLHIGGVRTALYNYLFAKKNKGTFILRIEDTDQNRYVEGAEEYILNSLKWLGLELDEGPNSGGEYGPYRQSERKDIYKKYAEELVEKGNAYYAFDTPEELEAWKEKMKSEGQHSPRYDHSTRLSMNNSLTLDENEVKSKIESGEKYVIRLKIPKDEVISFQDLIRGEVSFQSNELDDKVLLKNDGMPTYHMANIVDDHLMKISHVIRGEEWLPSTAHHILLYRFLGWEATRPEFAHLPLILKPVGNGKLSKRDGQKFGFPVFPLSWVSGSEEDNFVGFREFGFLPESTINFLAFLGWNPGSEQELFTIDELIKEFEVNKIVKSGAKFNIDKAKWYNQQYIQNKSDQEIAELLMKYYGDKIADVDKSFLEKVCGLMKPRVELLPEIIENADYFFKDNFEYQNKVIRKKWKEPNILHLKSIVELLENSDDFTREILEGKVKNYIQNNSLSFGNILPLMRVAMTGTTNGPDLFDTLELLKKNKVISRFNEAFTAFDSIIENK